MAKKLNAKNEKRERNDQYASMIMRKKREKVVLKWELAMQERRVAARAVRVTLLPEERHSQAVKAP